ncbi:MAG: energy transducer TonB [Bacteroidales bacterium]
MNLKLASKQLSYTLKLFWVSALLISVSVAGAQTEEPQLVDDGVNSTQVLEQLKAVDDKAVMETNFIESNGIDKYNYKSAKVLNDVEMTKGPSIDSESSGIIIPQGSRIKTYKFYAHEGSWAIKYKDEWGFVPLSVVMQVKEEEVQSNFTPFDTPPKLRSNITIAYPEDAKANKIEGTVVFSILVGVDGTVKEYHLTKSVEGLDEAAIEAVKSLKFKPGKYQEILLKCG